MLLLLLLLLLLFLSGKSSGIFKRHTCSLPLSFSLRNLTLWGFTQEEKESPWRSASRTFGIIFFSNWLMLPLGCEFNDQLTWSIYWISFYSVLFPPIFFFKSFSVIFQHSSGIPENSPSDRQDSTEFLCNLLNLHSSLILLVTRSDFYVLRISQTMKTSSFRLFSDFLKRNFQFSFKC